MLKKIMLILLFANCIVMMSSCGDSTSNPPDGDQDSVDGDYAEDGDKDDLVDGDTDGDVEEGESDCTCNTDDTCCDGCQPINDGGFCDDGNFCTQTDSCSEGVCMGEDPVVCAAGDQCHDAGICNPENGKCSNSPKQDGTECNDSDLCTQNDVCTAGVCAGQAVVCDPSDECHLAGECNPTDGTCSDPVAPDYTECIGDAGALGSGICFSGNCESLDQCLVRSYNQPANYPCNADEDCESRICIHIEKSGKGATGDFCSQRCGEYPYACPDGMYCNYMERTGEYTCFPESGTMPGDSSLPLYAPCNSNDDCESGTCSGNRAKYCTKECSTGDNTCGACGECKELKSATMECVPTGLQDFGGLCMEDTDCADEQSVCFMNKCSLDCSGKASICPDNTTCASVGGIYGDLCIENNLIGTKTAGDKCERNYQCESDLFCETNADAGLTTEIVIPDDNYFYVPMYAEAGQISRQIMVDARGTAAIIVDSEQTWQTGPYRISVTRIGEEPVSHMDIEPNSSERQSQWVELPFEIEGYCKTDDTDRYLFDVVAGDWLEVKVEMLTIDGVCKSRGDMGADCLSNRDCSDGLYCHTIINKCSQNCSGVEHCPGGSECISAIPISFCYDPALKGDVGDPCHFDGECQGEICMDGQCNMDCDDSRANCPTGYTCEVMEESPDVFRCLKDIETGMALGESCQYGVQCESGICFESICVSRCNNSTLTCPVGLECVAISDGGKISYCMAEVDYGRSFGAECSKSYHCASLYCFDGHCNELCTPSSSKAECTSGYVCKSIGETTACIDNGNIGEACFSDYECLDEVCLGGFCVKPCDTNSPDCPVGSTCTYTDDGDYCVADNHLDQPFGSVCGGHFGCEQGHSCIAGKCTTSCKMKTDDRGTYDDCPDKTSCIPMGPGYKSYCFVPPAE